MAQRLYTRRRLRKKATHAPSFCDRLRTTNAELKNGSSPDAARHGLLSPRHLSRRPVTISDPRVLDRHREHSSVANASSDGNLPEFERDAKHRAVMEPHAAYDAIGRGPSRLIVHLSKLLTTVSHKSTPMAAEAKPSV